MSRRILEDVIRDCARREAAELSRPRGPATYVVVFDWRGEHQRFLNGRRLVTEYPDAAEFRSIGKANAAVTAAAAYLKGMVADVVENYGMADERSVLRIHTKENPNWRGRGAHVGEPR